MKLNIGSVKIATRRSQLPKSLWKGLPSTVCYVRTIRSEKLQPGCQNVPKRQMLKLWPLRQITIFLLPKGRTSLSFVFLGFLQSFLFYSFKALPHKKTATRRTLRQARHTRPQSSCTWPQGSPAARRIGIETSVSELVGRGEARTN